MESADILNGGCKWRNNFDLLKCGKFQATKWRIATDLLNGGKSAASKRRKISSYEVETEPIQFKGEISAKNWIACCLFPEWAGDGGGSRRINYVNHRAKVVHLVSPTCADDEYRKTCTHFRLWPVRWWICAHNSTAQADNLWTWMDFFFWNLNNYRVPQIE